MARAKRIRKGMFISPQIFFSHKQLRFFVTDVTLTQPLFQIQFMATYFQIIYFKLPYSIKW